MSDTTEPRCAACRALLLPDDRFCEQCGARRGDDHPENGGCQVCGAPESRIDDGYCSICGTRERGATRIELDLAVAAAVSDIGLVHRRNEDAFRLDAGTNGEVAAVVCDGVSSSSAGDAAARTAVDAVAAVLAPALADPGLDAGAVSQEAIRAAQGAVGAVQWTTRLDRDAPSCTLVCALCRDGEIVVGSVGDSRAYWIDAGGTRQLTVDDSWAEEQVTAGELTAEQAFQDPRAHAITNWIGPDAPPREPRLATLHPDRQGRLVLCTDGLWNYLSSPGELGALIEALPAGASVSAVARSLADAAVARGGRDNVTVAVIDIHPPTRRAP